MSNHVEEQISAVLKQVAELPDSFTIAPEQELKSDLNIDSLKLIDVIVQVEAALDVEIGDEFSRDLVTVADLQRYVGEQIAA
ncbi:MULTISPECIES: acyl carrier protein [unclassified Streptomyces]|uniref:acyl carrier protein n=1 Tax=unclassified Streptomyces TaxID=2593676 RepID=UPI0004CAC411|nr:acyl carrier protein [Streptomyces sp. NRRL S-118]